MYTSFLVEFLLFIGVIWLVVIAVRLKDIRSILKKGLDAAEKGARPKTWSRSFDLRESGREKAR